MYGDTAVELLRELKRSPPASLPPYNAEGVRKVLAEMHELYDEVRRTIETKKDEIRSPAVAGSMITHTAAIERNKRCILAYLHHRLGRLQALRWEAGAIVPEEWRTNLSEAEARYVGEYGKLLTIYTRGHHIDLTSDMLPPKELFVQVRVLREFGEHVLESGETVMLTEGTQHLLRRSDVEPLIRQGFLQHIG